MLGLGVMLLFLFPGFVGLGVNVEFLDLFF